MARFMVLFSAAFLYLTGPHDRRLLPVAQAAVSAVKCSREFEPCYFRDCCGTDLTCMTKGSSGSNEDGNILPVANRNSTSYSARSLELDAKSHDEKLEMVQRFYEELVAPRDRKSTEQIERMVNKHVESFPRLVSRLEMRYKISFLNIMNNNEDEEEL